MTGKAVSSRTEAARGGKQRRAAASRRYPLSTESLAAAARPQRFEQVIAVLRDLAAALARTAEPGEAYSAGLDAAMAIADMPVGAFYLRTSGGGLEMVASKCLPAEYAVSLQRYEADSPQAAIVVKGEPIYAAYADLPECHPAARLPGVESIAILPLRKDGQALGCICLGSPSQAGVVPALRIALEAVVTQVGEAVARLQAEEELRQTHGRLESRVRQRTRELMQANRRLQREIAEHLRSEENLERAERLLRNMSDATQALLCILDVSPLRAVYVNRPFRELLGATSISLSQIDHAFLVSRLDEAAAAAQAADLAALDTLKANDVWQREWRGRDAQGRWRWVHLWVSPYCFAPDGKLQQIVCTGIDITEQKEAERSARQVERLVALGTLAAGIAHELNNPLGAIVLSVETAQAALREAADEPLLEASLSNIQASAMRCSQIIKNVLQLARNRSSVKSPASLGPVLQEAVASVRSAAQTRDVTVALCPPTQPLWLSMNATDVLRAIVNLLANAIEASAASGEVRLSAEPRGERVAIVVQDQGCGISSEHIAHIFDPFYTTRIHEGGTGLGLTLVHHIVHDHGGAVEVESAPGKGAVVTLLLPRLSRPKGLTA